MNKYYSSGKGLGDIWHAINRLIAESKELKQKQYFTNRYQKGNKVKEIPPTKVKEILDLLDPNREHVQETNEIANAKINYAKPRPPYKQIIEWQGKNSNTVCYQIDGKSHKNFSNINNPEQEKKFLDYLNSKYTVIRLGWGMALKDCVEHLSKCRFYVGVDSGFMHVALSCGCPTIGMRNLHQQEQFKIIYQIEYNKMSVVKDVDSFINNCDKILSGAIIKD